jgi:hypothetical protein
MVEDSLIIRKLLIAVDWRVRRAIIKIRMLTYPKRELNEDSFIQYLRDIHNLRIGNRTAENVILQMKSIPLNANMQMITIRGVNSVTNFPMGLELTNDEFRQVFPELKLPSNDQKS